MFSACFSRILRVRKVRKILDVFEVFPWFFFFKKTKEKKDRVQGGYHSPKMVRYPPLVLSFTQAHNGAIPHFAAYRAISVRYPTKQARTSFAILSLQVSRDMTSIAAGPLSMLQHITVPKLLHYSTLSWWTFRIFFLLGGGEGGVRGARRRRVSVFY